MPEDERDLMPVGLTQSNGLLKWRLFSCLCKKRAGQKASKEEKGPPWLKDGKEFRQSLSTEYSHRQVAKKPYTHKGVYTVNITKKLQNHLLPPLPEPPEHTSLQVKNWF